MFVSNLGKIRQRLAVFALALLFLPGCSQSSDLTRDDAKNLIAEAMEYPIQDVQTMNLSLEMYSSESEKRGSSNRLQFEWIKKVNASGAGAATIVVGGAKGRGMGDRIDVMLFDEARKFVIEEDASSDPPTARVVRSTRDIVEVTGISYRNENRSIAVVQYTERTTHTPFAKILDRNNFREGVAERETTLTLYDDGWRVSK